MRIACHYHGRADGGGADSNQSATRALRRAVREIKAGGPIAVNYWAGIGGRYSVDFGGQNLPP